MLLRRAPRSARPEPLWWFLSRRGYAGDFPGFHDTTDLPSARLLREHADEIRTEVLDFFEGNRETLKANRIPYSYEDPGWKTFTLYSMGLRYPKRCARLPFLDSVVSQIPGMTTTTVSVLQPQTRIHAHYGPCSGFIRTHLGIKVPGTLPEVGIRVAGVKKCWVEGETIAIEMARRHRAWNLTDEYRIILTVDTIKDEYADRKNEICGRALATLLMQYFPTRWPVLKRVPMPVLLGLQQVIGVGFRTLMLLQRRFGLTLPEPPRGAPVGRDDLAAA